MLKEVTTFGFPSVPRRIGICDPVLHLDTSDPTTLVIPVCYDFFSTKALEVDMAPKLVYFVLVKEILNFSEISPCV